LAIDAQDNLYFTEKGRNRITKIDPQGIAHIIAGPIIQDSVRLPESGFGGDGGPATNALMNSPAEIAVDGNGNVYFYDEGNYRIRKVNAQGIISTVIGGGTADPLKGGMAEDGKWISTYALIVDKYNNLYVGYFGSAIIKITPDGRVSAVAGGYKLGYTPDGSKAMGAKLGWVYGLAFDANDHLYFSEYNNHYVRMIDGLGILRTVAGSGNDNSGYQFDCPALQATVSKPQSICFDTYNNMYIISDKYDAVLKVSK
jgi:serine/threonine-protein kinase